jgi:hypothetical protein
MKKVRHAVRASGCTLQLRSDQARLYIPSTLTSLNKGWRGRWFYLRNDDKRLQMYTQCVIFTAGKHWRWGAPREQQARLQPLLDALRRLQDRRFTIARVAAAFHCRRVLTLAERRLCLDEITTEASVESSRMASTALSIGKLLRRVKGMVGNADYTTPIPMRPDQGYVSLVTFRLPFHFSLSFLTHPSFSTHLQGLRGYQTTWPPVPEDAASQTQR